MPRKCNSRTFYVELAEAVVALKQEQPALTVRQIAEQFGISKSTVGRMLKPHGFCPTCGKQCGSTNLNAGALACASEVGSIIVVTTTN